MKKSLLYFSILIIVSNILIIGVGFITNIAFIDRFMGGLITVGTDQIIFILGALLGAVLVAKPLKLLVVYFTDKCIISNNVNSCCFRHYES